MSWATDALMYIGAGVVVLGTIAATLLIVVFAWHGFAVLTDKLVKDTKYNMAFVALMMKWMRASKEQRKELVEATIRSAQAWEEECKRRSEIETHLDRVRYRVYLIASDLAEELEVHGIDFQTISNDRVRGVVTDLYKSVKEANELEELEQEL